VKFFSVDGSVLQSEQLSLLASAWSSQQSARSANKIRPRPAAEPPRAQPEVSDRGSEYVFATDVAQEISTMLWNTDIFSRRA
jgi:hypothetical protein